MSDEASSAAISRELPQVIRAMSKGIDPQARIKMDGPAEKAVAEKYSAIGKTRALFGGAFGAVVGLGVWRAMKSKSRFFGAFMGGSGFMVGVVYGLLSIREEFFVDILSLPDDQSEFAKQARAIIERDMPQSVILKEAYRRMGNLSANSDLLQSAWEESKKQERLEMQRLKSWDEVKTPEVEAPVFDAAPVKKPKSVFGFAAPPSPAGQADAKPATPEVAPTTWDEIRRRNAASSAGRS
ncbi:hypothetical protein AeMF1_003120 [Aphanomyces euteiches]|nr:hypothetical protein AeMF1_003120 [Aphanomyces euteiches]KAH9191663.1 hypothetical protein AeNC1_006368 [Aphanomyces euteiches]